MIRKLSMVALLTLTGWINTSNAALVGACTLQQGCGPDFAITGMGAINYTYNAGTDTGVLNINGTVGNASFLAGQLDNTWENTLYAGGPNAGNPYGRTSLMVLGGTNSSAGNDDFALNITVDGTGALISSSVTMNGAVGVFDGGFVKAISASGLTLDGNLILDGSITQLGWSGTTIDFLGSIGGSSLLATDYGTSLGGVLGLSNMDIGAVQWDQSWSAQSATLDVVVPVPAAAWLFASGLIALFATSRRKISV